MASDTARKWMENREPHPNSAGASKPCVRCGAKGGSAIVRMSIRIIGNTCCYERERLCTGCRGAYGFMLEEYERRLVDGAPYIIPSLNQGTK